MQPSFIFKLFNSPKFLTTEIVYANTKKPDDNRELGNVYHIKDIPGKDKKSYFYGFSIIYEIDLCHTFDVEEDPFKARIYTHNTILFSFPSWVFALRHDAAQFAGHLDPFVMDAIDDYNHKLKKEKGDLIKHVLLVFPKTVQLNAKMIAQGDDDDSSDSDDDELELADSKAVSDVYGHPKFKKGEKNGKHFLCWVVGRLDVKSYKKGRVTTKKKKNRLADKFGFGDPYNAEDPEDLPDANPTPDPNTSGGY